MLLVKRYTCYVLSLLIMIATELNADTKSNKQDETQKNGISKQQTTSAEAAKTISYQPPRRGAPAVRIGGGTRGIGNKLIELVVFAPDHTGFTIKEQPTLYWYASEPVVSRIDLTIINGNNIDPELEIMMTKTSASGVQKIDLAETEVKLDPGIEYRWFVSVVAENDQRSNDVVASGTIQRIVPDADLLSEIMTADDNKLIEIYAREGIWYDTVDLLTKMSNKQPNNSGIIEQRASLLEQVGLNTVAARIRKDIK